MGIEPTSEAWEASNKNLKALELAALNDFRLLFKWKTSGKWRQVLRDGDLLPADSLDIDTRFDLSNVYRFESGRFEGLTVEQAVLQSPADMYDLGRSAMKDYARYPFYMQSRKHLGREIIRLWMSLCHAEVAEKCFEFECERGATSMTFASATGGWSPMPWFWCNQHGPKDPDVSSPKMLISMDEIRQFRTKRDRRRFAKELKRALGIASGTRITGQFAQNWLETTQRCLRTC